MGLEDKVVIEVALNENQLQTIVAENQSAAGIQCVAVRAALFFLSWHLGGPGFACELLGEIQGDRCRRNDVSVGLKLWRQSFHISLEVDFADFEVFPYPLQGVSGQRLAVPLKQSEELLFR